MEESTTKEDVVHGSVARDGWLRRDALKAIAMMAAPLAAQTRVPAESSQAIVSPGKRNQPFDDGWRFLRGDAPGAEQPDFNDQAWRTLDLPHDFSVEDLPPRPADANGEGALWGTTVPLPTRIGPFDTELSPGRLVGWFVGGIGWYRKRFSAAAMPPGGQLEIVFDGVYMNSDVWLNGKPLGNHPYGYSAFAYDLTPHLRRDGENVLAVRVRNEGNTARWYSGSGIYRHVWLNATGNVRVSLWGVFVTTPEVSKDSTTANVAVEIENRGQSAEDVTVRVRLYDSRNAIAGTHEVRQSVAGGGSAKVEQAIPVTAPQLWSPGSPQLYRADVELRVGGRAVDVVSTSFGIRKVEMDAERGLRINGESLKLRGGCLHHDNGILGSCAIGRAEERRVELMKAHGFNAIRTSHNPPSSPFLDACDRLGVLVIDEAFDVWERQKNSRDYHLYFSDWWQRDLSAMVLRDRNHPSVIVWSLGNEIPERMQPRGVELAKQLLQHVKTMDATRPVTNVNNGNVGGAGGTGLLDPAVEPLDLAAYNYLWQDFEATHARHPQRVIVETESYPQKSYQTWRIIEKNPYAIGDFVWTGMDYMGESAIGMGQVSSASGPRSPYIAPASFPWFNAYSGDIDLIGQPKPQWFIRRIFWGLSKLEMAVQRPVPSGRVEEVGRWGWSDELRSWTWPGAEGKTVKVRVYSSGDQVRLLLNGKEVGVKPVSPESDLTAEFELAYAPGELKAIASLKGEPIAELSLKTVGKPAKLRLTADRASIRRTRNDLSFVTLEVVDEAGELVPDAVAPVSFTISGAAEIAAAGNANPKDVESFRRMRPKTFRGRCLAIVRPKGVAGAATLRAEAAGLAPATVVVQMS